MNVSAQPAKPRVVARWIAPVPVWLALVASLAAQTAPESWPEVLHVPVPSHPGLKLYFQGELTNAYKALMANPDGTGDTAEFFMGRIQERLGNLDLAIEHFERALEHFRDWEAGSTHAFDASTAKSKGARRPLEVMNHTITWENLSEMYEAQGRMGIAYNAYLNAERVVASLPESAAAFGWPPGDCINRVFSLPLVLKLRGTDFLSQSGHYDEALRLIQQIGEKAAAKDCYQLMGQAWERMVSHLAFLERFDEAVRLGDRMERLPFDQQYDYRGYLRTIKHAAHVAARDGVTTNTWAMVDGSLGKLEAQPHQRNWFEGMVIKLRLLAQDGRVREALETADKVVGLARQKKHQPTLADTLKERARLKLSLQPDETVASDLRESLQVYRSLGRKNQEPDLYELQARWLGKTGRYRQALETFEQAYELCLNLKLPFRALHMLIGIAELQAADGRAAELPETWRRIESLASTTPDLPAPTGLRLRLARLERLRRYGGREELAAAYQEAQRFAGNSGLSPHQLLALTGFQMEPVSLVNNGSRPRMAQSNPPLALLADLQPVRVVTRVHSNELARARFTLSNPSGEIACGTLKLSAEQYRFAWLTNAAGLLVKLLPPNGRAEDAGRDLQLAPGRQLVLTIEAAPGGLAVQEPVLLEWRENAVATASWDFGYDNDQQQLAVVNANLAFDNPFYGVPLFHEVYYRGDTDKLVNLRVNVSEPCRVEVVDATSRALLAIDAQGDGDFRGVGDVIYADLDSNGYPDFAMSNNLDVRELELMIFPHFRHVRQERELQVTLSIQNDGNWVPQGANRLIVK